MSDTTKKHCIFFWYELIERHKYKLLSGEETYGVFSDGLFAGGASHGGLRGIFNTDSTTTNGYSVASTGFETTAVK